MSSSDDDFLEDELFDDDFEFVDEEPEDIDEVDDSGIDTEYEILPFFSMYASKLPEKNNPVSILKSNEILLFDPFDNIQPYRKVENIGISLSLIKNFFIVSQKNVSDMYNLKDKNEISDILKNQEELLKGFYISNEIEDEQNNYKYKRDNTNKNNAYSNLKPRNPNAGLKPKQSN